MDSMTKMRLVFGDVTLGIAGDGFHAIFSYATGGLDSLVIGGREWLYRTVKPTFWRATTCNDRGSSFPLKSGMWMAADAFIRYIGTDVVCDGQAMPALKAPENNCYTGEETAQEIVVTFHYETITVPAAKVDLAYTFKNGRMHVQATYAGCEGLPQLPCFGVRMIMPTKATGFTYAGLSGETYPDRMAGGVRGVYSVEGLPVTPYIVPQECGMHMDSDWVEVTRDAVKDVNAKDVRPFTLRIEKADAPFAFSALPYTCHELENATHHEELPPARRTVLCLYGAVRGVGGIDSWGSDVEPAYHIDAQKEISFGFDVVL